jgi:hypothetical protein
MFHPRQTRWPIFPQFTFSDSSLDPLETRRHKKMVRDLQAPATD